MYVCKCVCACGSLKERWFSQASARINFNYQAVNISKQDFAQYFFYCSHIPHNNKMDVFQATEMTELNNHSSQLEYKKKKGPFFAPIGLISQQIGAFQQGVGSARAVAHAAQAGDD